MTEYKFEKIIISPPQSINFNDNEKLVDLQLDEWKKFENVEKEVISTINRIDDIKNKATITKLFKYFDCFRNVKYEVKKMYNSQITTNAWLKCYEILCMLPIITKEMKIVNAFFNAELPGGFVSATNHYISTLRPGAKFSWHASSLYSGSDNELGDQYGLYVNNKNLWLMGEKTHNGDVTEVGNLIKIEKQIKQVYPDGVNLYTSDGGLDLREKYSEQEVITSKLNFGQIICGLITLEKGGSLIVKQFMFNKPFTISLIALVSYLFDVFYITKPATSRPVNSEVYLVGIGFKKDRLTKKLKEYLLDRLKNFDMTELLISEENLSGLVIKSILDAAKYIHGILQVTAVDNVIDNYYKYSLSQINKLAKDNCKKIITEFISSIPIKKLDNSKFLKTSEKTQVHQN